MWTMDFGWYVNVNSSILKMYHSDGDVDSRGGHTYMEAAGMWEISALSDKLCYKPIKRALK